MDRDKIFILSILVLILLLPISFLRGKYASLLEASSRSPEVITVYKSDDPQLDSELLWALIQNWRIDNHKIPYTEEPTLCTYASQRLQTVQGTFSHDGLHTTSGYVYQNSDFNEIGENLARFFPTTNDTFQGWLSSPTHRENLESSYTHSCLRCNETYCVQIFAKY